MARMGGVLLPLAILLLTVTLAAAADKPKSLPDNKSPKAEAPPPPPPLAPATPSPTPGKSGEAPGHSGEAPGNSGQAPGHSGETPGNSGQAPGHSGETPGNSGQAPGHTPKTPPPPSGQAPAAPPPPPGNTPKTPPPTPDSPPPPPGHTPATSPPPPTPETSPPPPPPPPTPETSPPPPTPETSPSPPPPPPTLETSPPPPTPETPPPTPETPPPTLETSPPPPGQSPETPPPTPKTPPPTPETPPPKPETSPPPPGQSPETPPPTPETPPTTPVTPPPTPETPPPTPETPPPTPETSPPPPGQSPETPPPTPETPPTTPPTPQTSPPPPGQKPMKVKCHAPRKLYPNCPSKMMECPDECSQSCFADCNLCKPVCVCSMPGACGDPRFIGGDGNSFYFHGRKDTDFCVLSDRDLHINAHFIGKRGADMSRDFTWIQAIAVLFDGHNLYVGAKKTAKWDDGVDRLELILDGEPVHLPEDQIDATWTSRRVPTLSVTRTKGANGVLLVLDGRFSVRANVVPITEEDSRVHHYGKTAEDSLAHLELAFKFDALTEDVHGVVGQTYRSDYVNRFDVKATMPTMGGKDNFATSSLFAPDCAVARFGVSSGNVGATVMSELAGVTCASGMNGQGVVCKK